MKSVTISVTMNGGIPSVALREGEPWKAGAALVPARILNTDLWQGSGLTAQQVREGILSDTPNIATLKKTAAFLGGLLLGGETGKAWAAEGSAVRTYLEVDPTLDWIPWETARIPPNWQAAFTAAATPFMRYRKPGQQLTRPLPDRVVMLVVAAADPANETIGVDAELRLLREAVRPADRFVELRILRNPARLKIFEELKEHRPAILHFIGHGSAAELKLLTQGQQNSWSVTMIGEDLDAAQWVPALVVLNACRSLEGKAEAGATERTWSVAGTFLEKGASAVIAMQGPVSGAAAGLFSHEFYRQVINGATVDGAVAAARHKLSIDPAYAQTRDPYLPALITAGAPDGLLVHASCRDSDDWLGKRPYPTIVSNCEVLDPAVHEFVDREQNRWTLLDQFAESANSRPVSIVVGPSGMGKTWLLAWCMDGWLRRRRQVRYVRMSGCGDWLEFVRRVRDGNAVEPGVIFEPLPEPARDQLNWSLNHFAKGRSVPPRRAPTGVADSAGQLEKVKLKAPEFHIHGFAALADALDRNDDGSSFILVLDDFEDGTGFFPSEDFGYLIKHFLAARILAQKSKVRVILSLSDSEVTRYKAVLPASVPHTPLLHFSENLADHIRLLYKLRFKKDLSALSEENLPVFAKRQRTGEELRILCQRIYDYELERGL